MTTAHFQDISAASDAKIREVIQSGRTPALTRLHFGVYDHPDGSLLKTLCLPRFTHLSLASGFGARPSRRDPS